MTQLSRKTENVELVENERGELVTFTNYTNRELEELKIEALSIDEETKEARGIKALVICIMAVVYLVMVDPKGTGFVF